MRRYNGRPHRPLPFPLIVGGPEMAKAKEDPMKSSHYMTQHAVGPFAKGATVTTEELHRSFGRDKDATPEEHEAHRSASLKRLLDVGAITPTEAPEEASEEQEKAQAQAKAEADRKAAEDEAAARKKAEAKK